MDIAQLRYPVAYWDGTPPVHNIVNLAISSIVAPSQRITVKHNNDRHSINQYAITCSSTGELVHWEIDDSHSDSHADSYDDDSPNDRSNDRSIDSPNRSRTFIPRSMLLRMGSARLTCSTRCVIGDLDVFIVGSVEGFLTVWTATAGRCVRSALVVPFAPSTLTAFTRSISVRVGGYSVNQSTNQSKQTASRTRIIQRSYVVCSSVQSPYVHIVSLPHLKTVKILKHDSEVAQISVNQIALKSASQSISQSANQSQSKRDDNVVRPILHCLTLAGTLYRWDLHELTSPENNQSVNQSINQSSSVDDAQLVTSKPRAPIVKLPIPNQATSQPTNQCLLPICFSLSGSGNLILVAFRQHFAVYSIINKSLHTPFIALRDILQSINQHTITESSVNQSVNLSSINQPINQPSINQSIIFVGCHLLPSFVMSDVLSLRLLVWTNDNQILLLTIEKDDSKLICSLSCRFVLNQSVNQSANQLINSSSITVDGRFIIAGNHLGELIEWTIPDEFVSPPSINEETYINPFDNINQSFSTVLAYQSVNQSINQSIDQSSDPLLNQSFVMCTHFEVASIHYPTSHNTVASAFDPSLLENQSVNPSIQQSTNQSSNQSVTQSANQSVNQLVNQSVNQSNPDEVCTSSVLLGEGSGRIAMLARGFESGLIRVYGPASRSPVSPSGSNVPLPVKPTLLRSTSAPESINQSIHQSFSADKALNINLDQPIRSHEASHETVIDLHGHTAPITCLLSIGGREFGCQHALLASGSIDASVCVWDVSTATMLRRIVLPIAISSLHRPAPTEDDYLYYSHGQSTVNHVDTNSKSSELLQESTIKELYAQAREHTKSFTSADIVTPRNLRTNEEEAIYNNQSISQSNIQSPSNHDTISSNQSINQSTNQSKTMKVNPATSLPGVLFVSTVDQSLRVYSLIDYSLVQAFRGHDSEILTVFRDRQSINSDQLVVQTVSHSVYIWSLLDGSLIDCLIGDSGALTFLSKRALIAPQSQLSILAHHLRQKGKQESTDQPPPADQNEKDAHHNQSESNGQSVNHSRNNSFVAPTSPKHKHHHFPFNLSIHSHATPAHVDHIPSPQSISHPMSANLITDQRIDRRAQQAMLTSLIRSPQHEPSLSDVPESADEISSNQSSPPSTPSTPVSRPSLRRAATLGSTNELDSILRSGKISADSSVSQPKSATKAVSPSVNQLVEPVSHGLYLPIIDPLIGTKKLRHAVDCVRVDGKSHLHVSLLIVNLNQLIDQLERLTAEQSKRSRSCSPTATPSRSAKNGQSLGPHEPSLHHLAVEAIDPSPEEELHFLLSTLFDWDSSISESTNQSSPSGSPRSPEGFTPAQLLRDNLHCHAPFPRPSFAAITDNSQALTLLFPNQSINQHRWSIDADMTARQSLAIAAACSPMIVASDQSIDQSISQSNFSKIIAYYNSMMPYELDGYVEPDVSVLALFSINSNEHVNQSARLIIQGVIERATPRRRAEITDLFSLYYANPQSTNQSTNQSVTLSSTPYVSDQEMMTAFVLILIGLTEINVRKQLNRATRHAQPVRATSQDSIHSVEEDDPSALNEHTMSIIDCVGPAIASTLVRVLSWARATHANDLVKCALAADLFARALPLLQGHLTATQSRVLVRRLYLLSMASQPSLANHASRALLEYGRLDPTSFVACMSSESQSTRNSSHVRQSAFLSIGTLVKRHSLALAFALPAAVNVCVKALDPNEPMMRKTLLNAALATLHAIDQQYPTVALHHGTQRCAVALTAPPTHQSVGESINQAMQANNQHGKHSIVMYDLQKGQQIKVFDSGLRTDVTALAFSARGTYLASYQATDSPPALKVWQTVEEKSGGFLGRLMHSKDDKTLVKTWHLGFVQPPGKTNGYYADVEKRANRRWAEDEDEAFRLVRSTSKANLNLPSEPRTLTVHITDDMSPMLTSSQAPAHFSPLSSPALRQRKGADTLPAITRTAYAQLPPDVDDEEDDETTQQQLTLKSYLNVKLEWKDDQQITLVRENGDRLTFKLD